MDKLAFDVTAKFKRKKLLDSGRTVYMYSERQVADRNRRKARRLEKLRKNIKALRSQVKRDLTSDDPAKSLTALAVGLIDHTYERVGSPQSAKGELNDDGEPHFGVTTWTKSHISFGKGNATIKYVGKSGVKHKKKVTDASLVKALRKAFDCLEGDDDCVFNLEKGSVGSKEVNAYLKTFGVTAKDLRGFHANREMQERLRTIRSKGGSLPEDKKEREKKLKDEFKKALEQTAEIVGHEASTLRSQYLIPKLEDDYLKDGSVASKMTKQATVFVKREPWEEFYPATDCFPPPEQRPTAYPTTEWNIGKNWDGSPIEDSEDGYEPPLAREGAVKAPPGWTEEVGEAGRPFWTSPDGKVEIVDGRGRPGMQRYQVIYLEGGKRLEGLGWPSLKAALEYVQGKRHDKDHPLFNKGDSRLLSAEEWSDVFSMRHPNLKKHLQGVKVLDKTSGGGGYHGEARQDGNEIWLFPKFWKLDAKTRDFVFAHEIGHYVLGEYGLQKFIQAAEALGIDPWKSTDLPFGQPNMDEAFADCFASYHLVKSELKQRYPLWETLVEQVLGKAKTAAVVTLDLDWVEKMRKDFLTLLKNVPRLKDYDDAVTLSTAITTYANRFKDLFFDHFLNTSLKYEEKSLSEQDKNYIDKKLRKSGWDFYIELNLPFSRADDYYSKEVRFRNFQTEAKRWENRIKSKARTFWTDMKDTIDWYERIRYKWKDDPEKIQVKTPDVDLVTIEGFKTKIQGYDPDGASYMNTALEQVKWALRDYRQKAKQRLPILLQKQLPLVIDFGGDLSTGGRYERNHIWLNATSQLSSSSKDVATGMTKTLAHEMGHHIFETYLSEEATKLWHALIRGDYGDIDLRELLQKWPESTTWASDFSDSIRDSDPILSLQVATVSEGYQPGGMSGKEYDKREDFQRLLDNGETMLRVPKTPITGYAGKNPEEAFCETVGLLVAYGPRAVHEKIRSWLDVILPGQVKLAMESYER